MDKRNECMSNEHKNKISESNKRFYENHQHHAKGIKLSEEHKRKIGENNKRLFDLGLKQAPNKGCKRSKELCEKVSKGLINSWENRKGTPQHKLQIESLRKVNLGKHYSIKTEFKKGGTSLNKGKKLPLEQVEKHRKFMKNLYTQGIMESPMKNKHHSEESIKKIRIARAKQIFPLIDTKIEVKIQNYLKQLGIEFFTHQYMKDIEHGYQCDILIPVQEGIEKKTIIEAFGTYWHNYPYGNEKDALRTQELLKAGYRVLVFWEKEIKVMSLEDLSYKLLPLQLNADARLAKAKKEVKNGMA